MHVRIHWGKVDPGSWSALEQRYRELMDAEAPGLLARLVSRDVNDPENVFTITVWKDAESVRAWEASPAYRDVFLAAVKPYIIGAQPVSLCEVKVASLDGLTALIDEAATRE